MSRLLSFFVCTLASLSLVSCSNPQSGPDKTAAGMLLGAGWGAGAGAVVGNQVSHAGEGAGIGAGFGAVSGALAGAGLDLLESTQIDQNEQLASLRVQNVTNRRQLAQMQASLDRAIHAGIAGGVYQVFFDTNATSLRTGATANLETIASSMQQSAQAHVVHVVGHSDDTGSPNYNERLAEARARAVSDYLSARGISVDQIKVSSFGSKRPIASNTSDVGRQLNRRVDIYITQR